MKDMWEERYAADEYAYGEEPNAFFKACLDRLPAPGREKALRLAERHGVHRTAHRRLASALKPGGHLFLEAYSQEQLAYGTGGPPNAKLLYTLADLREDFSDLEIVELERLETEIHEGRYHTGLASVVRLIARR